MFTTSLSKDLVHQPSTLVYSLTTEGLPKSSVLASATSGQIFRCPISPKIAETEPLATSQSSFEGSGGAGSDFRLFMNSAWSLFIGWMTQVL